ncbi:MULTISPECIES: hypothetical protein [unclassified Novosphingobium]|uniref:hypothetical protein n=1 Tax=unclassified Novosphingobium TaxID=2644732 RepID=UPI001F416EEE|nr:MULTISPECIES: hypothetical protein [unclassified Novosphingobium]
MSALLIIGIPYYWYLVDPGAGPGATEPRAKPVTIAQLRALAAAPEGQRPVAVRVETVGLRYSSRNILVAGTGLRTVPNTVRAYELVVPGSGPIVIDAGTSLKAARTLDFEWFSEAAQARVELARQRASHTVMLSDRPSHNGGHAPGSQRTGPELLPLRGPPYALAPGVVMIPASGLRPGSFMLYAWLEDGREYLFTGDVAKTGANWQDLLPPARFATRGDPASYRGETLSWLMTINALHRAAPQMAVIAGHDPAKVPFSAGTFSD